MRILRHDWERTFKRNHSYLFLAAIIVFPLASRAIGNILWGDLRIINEPLHSTIEAVGAAIAIFTAIVLSWGKKEEYGRRFFPMAMGFSE